MGLLSAEDMVVDDNTLVVITELSKSFFIVVEGRVDRGSKGRMSNGHEPPVEATTLDVSKTLVHAGWAGEQSYLGKGDTYSWK